MQANEEQKFARWESTQAGVLSLAHLMAGVW
jgi:hypothetical protein